MTKKTRKTTQRIPYSDDLRHEVQDAHAGTGWGDVAIATAIKERNLPGAEYVTAAQVSGILYNEKLRSVDPVLLNSVLDVLRSVASDQGKASTYEKSAKHMQADPDLVAELNDALEKTTLSVTRLLDLYGAPEGLGTITFHKIKTGKQTAIRKSHVEFLRRLIETLNGS